jgi:hypothetical protein
MSHLDGRIIVDAVYHDKVGDTALKVLSLASSMSFDDGKVAIVHGTCGTAVSVVPVNPTTYRNAAGNIVSFTQVDRVVFAAESDALVQCDGSGGCGIEDWTIDSRVGQAAASFAAETSSFSINMVGTAGTASYSLLMWGAS